MPLKNRFRLAIIIPGKCKYILLNKNLRTCKNLQRTCKYIPEGLSDGFHVVPRGFRWFLLVPLSYPWFPLVILGYTRYLVIYDSNICEIVCAFAIIFPVICRKSKWCIIFKVNYHLGSKKSKFDMTLIRHSPFKGSKLYKGETQYFLWTVCLCSARLKVRNSSVFAHNFISHLI